MFSARCKSGNSPAGAELVLERKQKGNGTSPPLWLSIFFILNIQAKMKIAQNHVKIHRAPQKQTENSFLLILKISVTSSHLLKHYKISLKHILISFSPLTQKIVVRGFDYILWQCLSVSMVSVCMVLILMAGFMLHNTQNIVKVWADLFILLQL